MNTVNNIDLGRLAFITEQSITRRGLFPKYDRHAGYVAFNQLLKEYKSRIAGINAELNNAWATAERAEAELTKYRTKFADSMCAECMLYGIDCDCDALKEGE